MNDAHATSLVTTVASAALESDDQLICRCVESGFLPPGNGNRAGSAQNTSGRCEPGQGE